MGCALVSTLRDYHSKRETPCEEHTILDGQNPLRTAWNWCLIPVLFGVHPPQLAQDIVHS